MVVPLASGPVAGPASDPLLEAEAELTALARASDYAAERAGVSARELRDLARVDAALGELPAVEAAFLAGRVGWTQVRALCRAARPSAAPPPEDEPLRVGVVLRVAPEIRARWFFARQLANRLAGHALSWEAFADALTGEVLSGVNISLELPDPESAEAGPTAPARGAVPRACAPPSTHCAHDGTSPPAPPAFVTALEDGLTDADAFALDARLRRALRLEAQHLARLGPLLSLVVSHRIHQTLGFRSVDAWAEARLGMAASRAKALLRVERACQLCPALRAAWREGRLSWVQAQTLIPLLVLDAAFPRRRAWIDHAARVSVRRLAEDVERALASVELDPPALAGGAADPAGVQNGAAPRGPKPRKVRLFFTAAPDVARLFRATLARIPLEEMLAHALQVWGAYQPRDTIRREHRVFARDGWRCTAPGCSSYRNLHGHHIVFRSAGGSDDLANLITLCAWHHQRGVHSGRMRCSGRAPKSLRFELGVRSGRPPLAVYVSGDVRLEES